MQEFSNNLENRFSSTPWFFATFLSAVGLIILNTSMGNDVDETTSVLYSFMFACVSWLILQKLVFQSYGKSFVLFVNALFFAKILVGLFHFYYLFAPAAGIEASSEVEQAAFTGDMISINRAALTFLQEKHDFGLAHAVFGDYYRNINNPGVGVIYGILYDAFGPYPTVTFPMHALAMGLGCGVIAALADLLKVEKRTAEQGMIVFFCMPLFIVGFPMARDQFMITLLLLSAYVAMYASILKRWSSLVLLAPLSLCLGSLRAVYVVIPGAFAAISFCYVRGLSFVRILLVLLLLGITVGLSLNSASFKKNVQSFSSRTFEYEVAEGHDVAGKIVGSNRLLSIPARIAYALLTPMPWWQDCDTSLLVFQVFCYPQTLLSLTLIGAVALYRQEISEQAGFSELILMAVTLWVIAFVGSELFQVYLQIALPLLVLPSICALRGHVKICVTLSTSIIVVAHLAYLVVAAV